MFIINSGTPGVFSTRLDSLRIRKIRLGDKIPYYFKERAWKGMTRKTIHNSGMPGAFSAKLGTHVSYNLKKNTLPLGVRMDGKIKK